MKRIGGPRRKTRHKFKKSLREKGKLSLTKFFQKFVAGDRVQLKAEPAVQGGLYHGKFHGKLGVVESKSGRCYNVRVKDINKEKTLIIHPVHLKKL